MSKRRNLETPNARSSAPFAAPCALAIVLLVLLVPRSSGAQPDRLDADQASDFLGEWTLDMEIQGNPVTMNLAIEEDAGLAVARLTSEREPEGTEITDIQRDGERLVLSWSRDFGGQDTALRMSLVRESDVLGGQFGDELGFFSAEVRGRVKGTPAPTSTSQPRATTSSRRRTQKESTLEVAGRTVKITWANLSEDAASFWQLAPGEVASWTSARSIKLSTEADLVFDDQVVAQGNAAPEYPGVYSVWPQRTENGWALVFNHHADIWGSQRAPDADAVAVVAELSELSRPVEELTLELSENGPGGRISLSWGNRQLSADFVAGD